jgi:hypothetical protein
MLSFPTSFTVDFTTAYISLPICEPVMPPHLFWWFLCRKVYSTVCQHNSIKHEWANSFQPNRSDPEVCLVYVQDGHMLVDSLSITQRCGNSAAWKKQSPIYMPGNTAERAALLLHIQEEPVLKSSNWLPIYISGKKKSSPFLFQVTNHMFICCLYMQVPCSTHYILCRNKTANITNYKAPPKCNFFSVLYTLTFTYVIKCWSCSNAPW